MAGCNEATLALQREALIVEPDDAEEAIRIFEPTEPSVNGLAGYRTTQTRNFGLNRGGQ